jgi:hypothetical protein
VTEHIRKCAFLDSSYNYTKLFNALTWNTRRSDLIVPLSRGAKFPVARSPWRLSFVRWNLTSVGPQYGACFTWHNILRWLLKIWKICAPLLLFYYCLHTVPAPPEALSYRGTKFPAHIKSVTCVVTYCVTTSAISRSPWNMWAPRFCISVQATIVRRRILWCNHNRYRFLN